MPAKFAAGAFKRIQHSPAQTNPPVEKVLKSPPYTVAMVGPASEVLLKVVPKTGVVLH